MRRWKSNLRKRKGGPRRALSWSKRLRCYRREYLRRIPEYVFWTEVETTVNVPIPMPRGIDIDALSRVYVYQGPNLGTHWLARGRPAKDSPGSSLTRTDPASQRRP